MPGSQGCGTRLPATGDDRRPANRRCVVAVCLLIGAIAFAAGGSSIEIPVELGEGLETLEIPPLQFEVRDRDARTWTIEATGSLNLPATVAFPITISSVEPGWWSAPIVLDERSGTEDPPTLWLWPTGIVSIQAVVLDEGALPELPEARCLFCGCLDEAGEPSEPCGECEVRVDPDGTRYLVELPVGCRDLELLFEAYSALNYDRVQVSRSTHQKMVPAVLTRGGVIRGKVVAADTGRPLPDVRIDAMPGFITCATRTELAELPPGEDRTIEQTPRQAYSSYRGRFRVSGLEPDNYKLTFRKEGYADVVYRGVRPQEAADVDLGTVELGPGARIEVFADAMPCDDEEYEVSLYQRSASGTSIATSSESLVPLRENAVFRDVAAGDYYVAVKAACGAERSRVLAMEDVEVQFGEHAFLRLDLEAPRVIGRVVRDGEPVASRIRFQATESISEEFAVVSSPEEGFDAVFPARGTYRAVVENDDGQIEVEIEIEEDPQEIEILIPTASIEGTVVDTSGEPVRGGSVEAVHAVSSDRLRAPERRTRGTDENGAFRFESMSSGQWRLIARDGPGSSSVEEVHLKAADSHADAVRLVIEDPRRVEVWTQSETGSPVADATLHLLWRFPGITGSPPDEPVVVTTNAEGKAVVEVPGRIDELRVLATAPGRAAVITAISAESPVVLAIPASGGLLQLSRRTGRWSSPDPPFVLLTHRGGQSASREILWNLGRGRIESQGEGRLLTLGPLAPGRYNLTYVEDADEVESWWRLGPLMAADASVGVFPGQTTSLDLPF